MWLLVQGASAAITLLSLVAAGLQYLRLPQATAESASSSVLGPGAPPCCLLVFGQP